jgi:sugar/nucleoside kinase (ribokinase family)
MPTLLIAGPLALDDLPSGKGLLGGVGGYAAMAAAPLATTQLWCRGGSDLTPYLKDLLGRRGIDLAGVSFTGPTPRGGAEGFVPGGPLLPEVEPTTADDLGGVLLIGLPPDEMRRALRVVQSLPGAAGRTLFVSPRPADLADAGFRRELLGATDVLVLSVARACALTACATPLAAARALQGDGAKAVVLTAGQLGGLLTYGQKATTYPALPIDTVDAYGVSAAFAGALAGWCAGAGKADFRALKRGCAVASSVGGICAQGPGPKKLLAADRKEILERYNRLKRAAKG